MEDPRYPTPIQQIRLAAEENRRTVNESLDQNRYRFSVRRGPDNIAPGTFHSSMMLRFFLAILLFAGFCFMEREGRHLGDYDSSAICRIIQEDTDFSKVFKDRL